MNSTRMLRPSKEPMAESASGSAEATTVETSPEDGEPPPPPDSGLASVEERRAAIIQSHAEK